MPAKKLPKHNDPLARPSLEEALGPLFFGVQQEPYFGQGTLYRIRIRNDAIFAEDGLRVFRKAASRIEDLLPPGGRLLDPAPAMRRYQNELLVLCPAATEAVAVPA